MANRLDNLPEVYARDRRELREWLRRNHERAPGIWLIYFKKHTGKDSVDYEGAVREALCFGWIDSKVQRLDDERYRQVFMPRKAGSTWSLSNKKRVDELSAQGLIEPSGLALIQRAVDDGSWTLLDEVEALIVPQDFGVALDGTPGARDNYEGFKDSAKKALLWQIKSAKRAETRARRIAQIVEEAAVGRHPTGI